MQPVQASDGVGVRVVDQIRDLAQSEAQPPVGKHSHGGSTSPAEQARYPAEVRVDDPTGPISP